uniref:Uncharacterized protein n=1 Tax=Opuntia streptacantha TaxID=393608 RepID=A0A7C9AG02_OPUST
MVAMMTMETPLSGMSLLEFSLGRFFRHGKRPKSPFFSIHIRRWVFQQINHGLVSLEDPIALRTPWTPLALWFKTYFLHVLPTLAQHLDHLEPQLSSLLGTLLFIDCKSWTMLGGLIASQPALLSSAGCPDG